MIVSLSVLMRFSLSQSSFTVISVNIVVDCMNIVATFEKNKQKAHGRRYNT